MMTALQAPFRLSLLGLAIWATAPPSFYSTQLSDDEKAPNPKGVVLQGQAKKVQGKKEQQDPWPGYTELCRRMPDPWRARVHEPAVQRWLQEELLLHQERIYDHPIAVSLLAHKAQHVPAFQEQLREWIKKSKYDGGYVKAGANALTILGAAGLLFSADHPCQW